jgi:hypothetical protein
MSKHSDAKPQSPVVACDGRTQGWEQSLHAALAVLREIDLRYARDRARLEASAGVTPIKRHWLAQLEAQCRKEREPLVLRLADIHQRMTFASLSRTVH